MKTVDVFYNLDGIGDVLIIPIKKGKHNEIHVEQYGDITKITNQQKEILGYNVFNASKYFTLGDHGKIPMTEDILNDLKILFHDNKLDDPLNFDLSPKFVVGHVLEKSSHENADKLSVCKVDVGEEVLQIVCGAPNVEKDQKVVVAKIGATMPSGLKIKPTTLRGVDSFGMICSKEELGLPKGENEKGIYILDDSYPIGEEFIF